MKRFLLALIITVPLICCTTSAENLMHVSGTINGLRKGTLFLQKVQDSILVNLDSLEIKGNGNFSFEQFIEEPEIFYLYLEKADNNDFNDRITFFGEKGTITIRTTWNQFEQKAKITGSKNQMLFEQYKAMLSNFNKRDLELSQISLAAEDSINMDSIKALVESNYRNHFKYIVNFALTNPNSYITPYIAITDGKEINPIYLDSIYAILPDSIANSKYGKILNTKVSKTKN